MATLELRDYLKAARLASDRARKVTVVLVIASVVVLIGMVNSMDHAWMERRLDRASNPDDPYVRNNIGRRRYNAVRRRISSNIGGSCTSSAITTSTRS